MTDGGTSSAWDHVEERLRIATAGRYLVERRLGIGGMGAVFLAQDKLGRPVAIKVLAPRLMANPEFEKRFFREARTIARLRHPHLVYIHDYDHGEGLLYFVMSYLPGRPLNDVCSDEQRIPFDVVRAWLYQVASALDYAHRQSVIHRDVKPSNVLLDEQGDAVLTDFGIAQEEDEDHLTSTGMIVGSPPYLSPERWNGERATPASDQYALGIVAYEMIVGRPPFVGPTLSIMKAHADLPPPPMRDRRPECPSDLEALVEGMLRKRPEDRWEGLQSVCAELGTWSVAATADARVELATSRIARRSVASLTVFSAMETLQAGEALALHAELTSRSGDVLADRELVWRTSDSLIATVTPEGVVQAHRPGAVEISAMFEGRSSTVTLRVASKPITSVDVSSATDVLILGETAQLLSSVRNVDGEEVEDEVVEWLSDDPDIAEVSADGLVTPVGSGKVRITAAVDRVVGWADLRVVQSRTARIKVVPDTLTLSEGESTRLSALAIGHDGEESEATDVSWSTRNADVVTVTADGALTAIAPGVGEITAASEGHVAAVSAKVIRTSVESMTLEPTSLILRPGDQRRLMPTIRDESGRVVTDARISWRTDHEDVARVDAEGNVTALSAGEAVITARCESVTSLTALEVRQRRKKTPWILAGGVVAAVFLGITGYWQAFIPGSPTTPPDAQNLVGLPVALGVDVADSIAVGDSVRLSAVGFDGAGNETGQIDPIWESMNAASLEIRGDWARALAAGVVRIRAISGDAIGEDTIALFEVGPALSTVTVQLSTTGADIDPRVQITLDDGPGQIVPANGALELAGVEAGEHTVRVSGLASNCSVQGGASRSIALSGGQPEMVPFSIGCGAVDAAPASTSAPVPVGPPGDPPTNGTLFLNIIPYGNVTIEGSDYGRVRREAIELVPGTYRIQVSNPNYPMYEGTVVIGSDRTDSLRIDLRPGGS